MPEHGLLGQLTTQKFVMALFLKEWLPFQAIGNLSTSAGTSSILTRSSLFMNPQHSLTQLTLEKANISNLKRFLRARVNTKFPSPIYPTEEIKKKILSSLKHLDADLEYRLLALNFLSENSFTFELPHDYDPLTLLLLDCANLSIDLDFIVKEIQRLLDKAQVNFLETKLIISGVEQEPHIPTKAIIIDIVVLMLNSIAHKLEKNQARALISQACDLCKKAKSDFNRMGMRDAISLLAVLTVKYQVKELHELVEFLADLDESSQGGIYKSGFLHTAISEVASQHPSTFTNAISQGLLNNINNNVAHAQAVLVAVRNNFLEDSQHDIVKNAFLTLLSYTDRVGRHTMIEDAIYLWSHLGDSQRDTMNDKLLTLLSDTTSYTCDKAIKAVTHIWNHFGDNLRKTMSDKLLTLLSHTDSYICSAAISAAASLWDHFEDSQRDIIKNTLLTLLSHSDPYLRRAAMGAAASLWDHFEDSQRDIIKNTLLTLLSHSDPYLRSAAIKAVTCLWNHLESSQHGTVKNTLLELLSNNANFIFCGVAADLWDQFDDSQRDNILSGWLLIPRNNIKAWLDDVKTFVISIISALGETQLSSILERMSKFFDNADVHVRTKAFDIFMCIICHHPDYDYHAHLNTLEDSLRKAYLVHAVDTIRTALQLPLLTKNHP